MFTPKPGLSVRIAAFSILFTCLLPAQPPLTLIQDVLYKADGTRFTGYAQIGWTSFEAADTSNIATQFRAVRIVDGNFSVKLVPTTNAEPPATYVVTYNSDGIVQFQETWAVPPSSKGLRIRDVRISTPSNLDSGGASPMKESDVVGLVSDLNSRPTEGPGFSTGRVLMANSNGELEAVSGNLSDCVLVDGTSAACVSGSMTYPAAGVAISSGSTWGTSLPVSAAPGANSIPETDGSGILTIAGGVKTGDGAKSSALILPELTANGANDQRIYGADNQASDGCIIWPTGVSATGKVAMDSGSTATTTDGKTCRVFTWQTPAGGGGGPMVSAHHLGSWPMFYDNAFTSLPFDTNTFGDGTMHSGSTNNTRFTAPTTGFYLGVCAMMIDSGSPSAGYIKFLVNGATEVIGSAAGYNVDVGGASPRYVGLRTTHMLSLTAGAYVECQFKDSAGSTEKPYNGTLFVSATMQLAKLF